jgi:hypothetical protein
MMITAVSLHCLTTLAGMLSAPVAFFYINSMEIKNHVDIDNNFDFQNITAERVEKIISQQTDKISQQPENWENRNGPYLVQAFPKKWWVESDFTAPNLPVTSKILSNTSLRVKLIFCEGQEKFEDIEIEGQTTQWSNEKGEWKAIRRLEPKDCNVGDVVLDFQNSICEIKEVKHNSNKSSLIIFLLHLLCVTRSKTQLCRFLSCNPASGNKSLLSV